MTTRTEQHKVPRKIREWRQIGRRSKGRPRRRWIEIEDVEGDLKNKGIRRWKRLCNERGK